MPTTLGDVRTAAQALHNTLTDLLSRVLSCTATSHDVDAAQKALDNLAAKVAKLRKQFDAFWQHLRGEKAVLDFKQSVHTLESDVAFLRNFLGQIVSDLYRLSGSEAARRQLHAHDREYNKDKEF